MSMREFLKGLELEADTIDNIMAEYGKNMQSLKDANETLKTQNESLKATNKTLQTEVDESKKIDIDAIKKEEFDKGVLEGNKEVETFKKSIALERALNTTKAKDVKLLQKLIDDSKITYEEKEGSFVVKGLEEQIKSIKETHNYLFDEQNSNDDGINLGGDHTKTPDNKNATTLLGALHEKYDK